jgi:flagellar motor switch protein FliN/FliY
MPDKDIVEEQIPQETVAAEEIEVETQIEEASEETSKVVSNFEPLVENINDAEEPEYAQAEAPQRHSNEETVTVQPVKFASFEDLSQTQGEANKNLDILMDIKLQLTVELGRTELPIKKVLELTRGSIIELEKVAGEPVELFANGKLVAHGEVVVIEDNFGLRITSITDTEDRLKGI